MVAMRKDNAIPNIPPSPRSNDPVIPPTDRCLEQIKADLEKYGENLKVTINNKGRRSYDAVVGDEAPIVANYNPDSIDSVRRAAEGILARREVRQRYSLVTEQIVDGQTVTVDEELKIVDIIENDHTLPNGVREKSHVIIAQQYKTFPDPKLGQLEGRDEYKFVFGLVPVEGKPRRGGHRRGVVYFVRSAIRNGKIKPCETEMLDEHQTRAIAKKDFGDENATVLQQRQTASNHQEGTTEEWWNPVWDYVLQSNDPAPRQWRVLVDAYTGEVFRKDNQLHFAENAVGKGFVPPDSPDPKKGADLKGQEITLVLEGIEVNARQLETKEFEFRYRNINDPKSEFAIVKPDASGNFGFPDGDPRNLATNIAWLATQQMKFIRLCGGVKRRRTIVEVGNQRVGDNAYFAKFPVRSIVLGVGKRRFRLTMCADGTVFLHEEGHDLNDENTPNGMNGWEGECMDEGLADVIALLSMLYIMSFGFNPKGKKLTAEYIVSDKAAFYIGAYGDLDGFLRDLREVVLATEETGDPHRLGIAPGGAVMACLVALVKKLLLTVKDPTPEELRQLVIETGTQLFFSENQFPTHDPKFGNLLEGIVHADERRNKGVNVKDFIKAFADRKINMPKTTSVADIDDELTRRQNAA